jgi:hypothetical protein
MSFLRKIRSIDDKIGDNQLSTFAGIIFLIAGICFLFFNPTEFLGEQVVLHGSYGAMQVPFIIFTLLGWTLLSYGVLNRINWSEFNKKNTIISRLAHRRKISSKNTVFIIASIIFISMVSILFLIIRPDERIRIRNEEFNSQIERINESWDRINKEIENQRNNRK